MPNAQATPSGEEYRKNAVNEGLTLPMALESPFVLAEQKHGSSVSLSEKILAGMLAGVVLKINAYNVLCKI